MNLANKISIARIIIIPFFIAAIVYSKLGVALVLFLLAVMSDAADGFIARTLKQKTKLGTMLDPVADKALKRAFQADLHYVTARFGIPDNRTLGPLSTLPVAWPEIL